MEEAVHLESGLPVATGEEAAYLEPRKEKLFTLSHMDEAFYLMTLERSGLPKATW